MNSQKPSTNKVAQLARGTMLLNKFLHGVALQHSTWAETSSVVYSDGELVSTNPSNVSTVGRIIESIIMFPEEWRPYKEPIKIVKRWKTYFLCDSGGLETVWLTEEEKFKVPEGDKTIFITEEIGEFPL